MRLKAKCVRAEHTLRWKSRPILLATLMQVTLRRCNCSLMDRIPRRLCKLYTGLGVALTQSVESLLRETGRQGVPIDIRPQMLYNPAMRAPNFYVPGVIGVVLQIGTTVAAAMALVRERERGTLEQLLVSPLSRSGLMLGKLVPYLCIGMAMAVILFLIMRFVFFVPIEGSVVAMMFSTLLYVFALLSLGLVVGTKAENQMQALQMSMVFLLP